MTQAEVFLSTWDPVGGSNATSPFFIIGDYESVQGLTAIIQSNCSANVSTPAAINSTYTAAVQPEQIIQYYRASSFALALTSYNDPANSFANQPSSNLSTVPTTIPAPVPAGTNTTLLECLNYTIGNNIPIMSPAIRPQAAAPMAQIAFLWVILWAFGLL